ncbi:MAG: STAS domain-containing protein [Spirochaetota bacterium]
MNKNNNIWSFPLHIAFEMVSLYSKSFEEVPYNQNIIFDLTGTKNIHSSFIGFLINAKQRIKKEGGKLELYISPELEKLFIKKDLRRFLSYNSIKKSA